MKKYLLIIIIIVTGIACTRVTRPLSIQENKQIIESIQQTFIDYFRDIRHAGLMAELKYLDSSTQFFWVPPGYSAAIPYDSVVNILQKHSALYRSINNSFDTLQIIPLSEELSTYTGRLQSIVTDTSGKTTQTTLLETGILIKRPGGWKLLSGQTSVLK